MTDLEPQTETKARTAYTVAQHGWVPRVIAGSESVATASDLAYLLTMLELEAANGLRWDRRGRPPAHVAKPQRMKTKRKPGPRFGSKRSGGAA